MMQPRHEFHAPTPVRQEEADDSAHGRLLRPECATRTMLRGDRCGRAPVPPVKRRSRDKSESTGRTGEMLASLAQEKRTKTRRSPTLL
jgi:hypothetical protein